MKLSRASLLGFLFTASAFGQHNAPAARAGSAHASASFAPGRSFSMAAPGTAHNFGSAPAYRPNQTAQPRSQYSSPIGPAPFGGTQPYNGHRSRHPAGDNRPYYSRGVYLVPGYFNYGFGYSDDSYYGDQQQQAPQPAYDANAQAAAPDYGPPPPPAGVDSGYDQAYGQAPPRPAYQPQAPPSAPVQDQPQVTLVFKDGRPPQQVQNYAVTRATLYVLDGAKRREIPLDQLDLPQTKKINRDAGVEFEIPAIAN